MVDRLSFLSAKVLWAQLFCFIIAVTFAAGGGQNSDLVTSYNNFIYFKAAFLSWPILVSLVSCCLSFSIFWQAFKMTVFSHGSLLLYFFFAVISLAFAYDVKFSAFRLAYTFGAIFSLWCLMAQYILVTDSQPRALIYSHLLFVFVAMAVGIPLFAGVVSGFESLKNLRAAVYLTGLIHPNTMASFCAYGFFHAIFYPKTQNVWQQHARYLLLALMPVLIMLIFSRSVVLSMIISLGVAGWFSFLWFRSYRSLAAIGACLSMALMAILLLYLKVIPSELVIGSIARTESGVDLWTLTHRTELWHRLLETLTLKIAILGNGYGVMVEEFGLNFGTGIIYGAHNVYLSILFGTGIFSLISFFVYLGTIFKRIRKNHANLGKLTSLHGVSILSFFMIHSMTSTEFSLNLTVSFSILMVTAALGFGRQDR